MISEANIANTNESKLLNALGQRLRMARELKQWSIEQVAERLHLSRQRVIDMENDQYKYSSAETYAKGYLRGYAKLLGLPADEMIEEFDRQEFSSHIESRTPQLIESKQIRAGDRSMKWATYAISIALVFMVGVWWHNQRNTTMVASAAPEVDVSRVTLQTPALPNQTPVPAAETQTDEQKQASLLAEDPQKLSQASEIPSEELQKG
ncbi:MAG: helix-turn-helix domain-containing protein [Pseudomonadota bacterium]|nr:helix-turn-helix domain-containing protein [Pseudomonadota bacterium]